MRDRVLLFAGAATLIAALAWASHLGMQPIDDAYITFRAAVNLAHGDGPVFNPGDRVESATSPLWVAVLALLDRCGISPVASSGPLALLFAGGAAALSAACALELGGVLAALLAGLALALLPAWSAWICAGMEVPLAALLIAASLLAALRGRAAAAGLLFAAACLARPEAAAILPALLYALRKRLPLFLACALPPLAALLLARHAYFGQWVPNTYIAKREGLSVAAALSRGFVYVAGFALANLIVVLAVARAAFRAGAPRTLALACLGLGAAVAWDGGDHFPLDRLLAPALPVACALFGAEVAALPRRALPAVLLLAILPLFVLPKSLHAHHPLGGARALAGVVDYTFQLRETGDALAVLPPGHVATVAIGAIGYQSGRNVLDLVGLTDRHIARSPHLDGVAPGHDHSDVDYVLAQRPELALFAPQLSPVPVTLAMEDAWLARYDNYFRAARLLQRDPRFRALYESIDVRAPDGRHLRIWQLR